MGGTPMPRGTGVPPVGLSGLSKTEMRPESNLPYFTLVRMKRRA